ncbi:uncharacterized protein LOC143033710 [Oratosquilla oratoria]|uniref:uncharacterized protein LOC143033710 n=1 Tax=Oratosquilla oratoria TaxID=337810 RepID=UPI003F76C382
MAQSKVFCDRTRLAVGLNPALLYALKAHGHKAKMTASAAATRLMVEERTFPLPKPPTRLPPKLPLILPSPPPSTWIIAKSRWRANSRSWDIKPPSEGHDKHPHRRHKTLRMKTFVVLIFAVLALAALVVGHPTPEGEPEGAPEPHNVVVPFGRRDFFGGSHYYLHLPHQHHITPTHRGYVERVIFRHG